MALSVVKTAQNNEVMKWSNEKAEKICMNYLAIFEDDGY